MSGFREIRSKMRADVHESMAVAALYILSPGSTPIPISVRVHRADATHGGLQGTNFHYGEREEEDVILRIGLAEIATPLRGAIVSVAPGEAYRIDRRAANDLDFVNCPALTLDAVDCAGLPVPGA